MSTIAQPTPHPLNWPLTRRELILLGILLGIVLPIAAAIRMQSPVKVTRHDGDFSGEFDHRDFDVSSTTYELVWPENAPALVVYDGDPPSAEIVRPGRR